MRDRDQPAMREYLSAERAYYDEHVARLRGRQEELLAELTARVPPEEESVRWPRGGFSYFTRTLPGQNYPQFCRVSPGEHPPGTPAREPAAEPEILLDQNLQLADPDCAGGYVELGVREVSPGGQLLAYSVDFDGDEVYQLRNRDLVRGSDLADRIGRTYYGLAWSADSRTLFYVVTDEPAEAGRLVEADGPHQALALAVNEDYDSTQWTRPAAGDLCFLRASRAITVCS